MDESYNFTVQIEGENLTQNELYELQINLRQEIVDIGLESVEFVKNLSHQDEGIAKSVDPVLIGALAIAVLPSVLTKLLEILQSWVMRQQSRVIKLKIQTDGIEIEVPETMTPAQAEKWIQTLKRNIKSKA